MVSNVSREPKTINLIMQEEANNITAYNRGPQEVEFEKEMSIIEPSSRKNIENRNKNGSDSQSIAATTVTSCKYHILCEEENQKEGSATSQKRAPRPYRYISNALTLDDTNFWTKIDLTADYQGSTVVSVSNEHYGSASNIIKTTAKPHHNNIIKETLLPKENEEDGFQDGWLVKRNEMEANAKIKLGASGKVYGVDIDTTGYIQCTPLKASLFGRLRDDQRRWTKILPLVSIKANSHNFFETKDNEDIYDQIFINMTPGGGIHRLRVFGDVIPTSLPLNTSINLSSTLLGSQIVVKPQNLLRKDLPNILLDRSNSSQDGWICPRNNNDSKKSQYTIIKLAVEGAVDQIIIDTTHFIGNSPKSVMVQGCSMYEQKMSDPSKVGDEFWINLIDVEDSFYNNIYPNMFHVLPCAYHGPVTHVRIQPIPDGGIQQVIFKGKVLQRRDGYDTLTTTNDSMYQSSHNNKRKRGLENNGSNKRLAATTI